MATTKETMKIIAMGLGETGAHETESCASCPLMDALARRAAEHFTEMTEEMDEEVVLEIVRKLETEACSDEPGAMITLLGRIFRQNGMESATAKMEALDYENIRHYTDDGYSGGSFDRPAWKEMIRDIEDGEIATVIAKDMSRIGRNYLEVAMYVC